MAKKRLLIVDDHEVVRLGLKAVINNYPGYEIIGEAANAKEAVQQVSLHQPDIVLMDIRLPGISGVDACEEIKQNYPDVKVIMLTSYAEDEMLFSAIKAGASGYVLKQVNKKLQK